MILRSGYYKSTRCSLTAHVVNIYYQNEEYAKARMYIYDKFGRQIYDPKNPRVKLYFKNIYHWEKCFPEWGL